MASLLALVTVLMATWSLPLDRFVFLPDREVGDPPPGVEERWITTADGVRLHAWYAGDPTRPTVIWSHGNAGNIGCRADVLLGLAGRGLAVLAYDYRGYGRSEGRPSENGVYLDSRAAYDSERARGVPASRLVAFGESLGGAVSIALAGDRPCAGVAVVSTFTTMRDVGRVHYGLIALLAGDHFDALSRIQHLTAPLFVVHGDRDEIVPFELGERLFAAAPGSKRFMRVAGARHNDVFSAPGVLDAIAAFAREVSTG